MKTIDPHLLELELVWLEPGELFLARSLLFPRDLGWGTKINIYIYYL